ncbi:MAG: GntR family transcriptional regulator [Deltaproteobacteria bacterium]|nr:GntR family transcriptional regulator [Deltaproteobacteria bacterium]
MQELNTQNTLREKIATFLREAIVKGELRPCQRIQEIEIAERYQTSRTPVREALRQLEAEGFLMIRARRGAIVSPITEKDITEFYEIRGLLESFAAEKAMSLITPEEIEYMRQLNGKIKESFSKADVQGILRTHNEFHEVIVHACGNERLINLIKNLATQHQRFRIVLSHTHSVLDSIKEHDEIIAALRAKDSRRLIEAVRTNSENGCRALIEKIRAINGQKAISIN